MARFSIKVMIFVVTFSCFSLLGQRPIPSTLYETRLQEILAIAFIKTNPRCGTLKTRDTMIPCRRVSWKELSITKQVNGRQRTNHVPLNCACPLKDSLTDWTNRKMTESYPIYETCAFMKLFFIFLLRREL